MLEQLFGSRTRVLLLRLFLDHPGQAYYVREIARLLGTQINSVRRELENLESFGLILPTASGSASGSLSRETKGKESDAQKKYYTMNQDFVLYAELKALFLKARLLIERSLVEKLQKIGRIRYLALTGLFAGLSDWPTDIFLVGQIQKKKMQRLIHYFEKELQHEIKYTVMTKSEFLYRREVTDRFIFNILEHPKIVVIDSLFPKLREKKNV